MSKKELVEKIANEFNLNKNKSDEILTFIFDNISEILSEGDEVSVSGFGKFSVILRPAREGRNPATGEKIQIAASRLPKFKAAKQLKDKLN